MERYTKVNKVIEASIAHLSGIESGDILLSINGEAPGDVLEYKFLISDEYLELEVEKKDGTIEIIEVDNPDYEDLGIVFEHSLLSKPRACRNKCIFCFIDQLPKGMRNTLYFKDDDYRLSFLQGNYVTLTNVSDEAIKKIVAMRISPINISVHTTNPDLREFMTGNKNAGNILEIMQKFAYERIIMNCQIVLCRDVNDGDELDKTLSDLALLQPFVNSISIVPVGLSIHRGGLFSLEPFDKQSAKAVMDKVEYWQWRILKTHKKRLVYAADELYLKAEEPIPSYDAYEDFPQIENGVGLIASFKYELEKALGQSIPCEVNKTISIATGVAASKFIMECARLIMDKYKGIFINVYTINNAFFGDNVTVAGLICGQDLIATLKGKELGEKLLLPSVMFRADDDVMLDDTTIEQLEKSLNIKVKITPVCGYDLVDAVIDNLNK